MTKRDKILETMLRLIAEQGVHNTPMSQIAKESEVATGTIYHHFSSKEEILNELYLELKKEFGQILRAALEGKKSFKDNFYTVWIGLYDYYINNPLKFSFAEQITRSPIINEETRKQGEKYYQPIISFFIKGVENDEVRNINVQLLTEMIYGNVLTLVQLSIQNPSLVNKELLNQAVEMSWKSISK